MTSYSRVYDVFSYLKELPQLDELNKDWVRQGADGLEVLIAGNKFLSMAVIT
jgi:hypothetical protein